MPAPTGPKPYFPIMKNVHHTLYREDNDDVAQCLDFDISSVGELAIA